MNYQSLLAANKAALYAKLDNVQKIKELYVSNDIIEVLSNKKERDMNMINVYDSDEVQIYTIKRTTGLKAMRFFTRKGLIRYLHEGKLYDYQTACEYFGVQPLDKQAIEYQKYLESIYDPDVKKYKTSTLLRWLFNKRKMCKELGDYTSLTDVLKLFDDAEGADQSKLNYLKGLVNPVATSSL
jgi:hypothetical protein